MTTLFSCTKKFSLTIIGKYNKQGTSKTDLAASLNSSIMSLTLLIIHERSITMASTIIDNIHAHCSDALASGDCLSR